MEDRPLDRRMPVFNLEEELAKLPAKPGVYLMHSKTGEIIYVGKAIKLKNRVRQYFQSSKGKTEKIKKMVSNIAWFEYILTDSEMEALVLECNLIKEYRPRYNTMLTDDKGYPFICVTVSEPFPRVFMSRTMHKDQNRYFGPYTSSQAVTDTLELLHKLYKIRTCHQFLSGQPVADRACLNYHMGRCLAPCQGHVDPKEYRKSIDEVIRFLNGDFNGILEDLQKKMLEASEECRFEDAIRYRDLLTSVRHVAEKQKITDAGSQDDRDVIAIARHQAEAVAVVFFVREGKLLGRDHFHMRIDQEESNREVLSSFVRQFYAGTPFIPREILLPEEIEDQTTLAAYLSGKRGGKVELLIPKRGQKEQLMELAEKNARMILDQDADKIKREEARTKGAVHEIEELTGLSGIRRMEAYDISNISGFESVGSMVVFEDGKPKKNEYRKFRIRTVTGPNDYASMEEVLTRRFTHGLREQEFARQQEEAREKGKTPSREKAYEREGLSSRQQNASVEEAAAATSVNGRFSVFPDLLLMDGGKGQVHIAEKVLKELGIRLPVVGMVKDDRHNTRGLYYHDRELPIDRTSEGFLLITRIQDEAHRFAITYHRGLHTQNSVHSVLTEIPGVGEKRQKALMRRFRDLSELQEATVEDIAGLDGFNQKAAEAVVAFLHQKPGK